ncbi:MAG TPA: hypothetical protein VFH83_07735 [Spirochaetia bacterium]|nr:hypothetical protein [Spirochaetia bacterium]
MPGFDFFRSRRLGYRPRTPAAALRAVETGTLPVEDFIYASTSAKPLDEEPFDLEEIERLLSRQDMVLQTSLLLKRVLGKLTDSLEQETALFGAEGIAALEGRALEGAALIASRHPRERDSKTWKRLARKYYELSELHRDTGSVRNFYLGLAHDALQRGMAGGEASVPDLALAVDILVSLGLHHQGTRLLEGSPDPRRPEILMLAARAAFHRGDYQGVSDCCRALAPIRDSLSPEEQRVVSFWTQLDG